MKTVDQQPDWKTLLSYLPDDYAALAEKHRLLNKQWPNGKIADAATLLRFILLHVGADLPLRQTVATMAQSGGPSVSQVWLHQKMRRAQPYLAALVQRLTGEVSRQATPERWSGYEVLTLDGSTVSGPGAEGADARMHAVLRIHDLCVRDVQVTTDDEGETLRRFVWQKDQLIVVDRGYANPPGIMAVIDHEADVLVRLNRGTLPLLDDKGDKIDVLQWCRFLTDNRASERRVFIRTQGPTRGGRCRQVAGRLIALRLPPEEAAQAMQRVKKEFGAEANREQLEAARYVILFTTAPAGRLSATRCVEAYRLRWQVELLFKRWKSLCSFDKLPNYRDDTIVAWLTAKVLLAMLLDSISSHATKRGTSPIDRPLCRQPWKATSIVWPLIVAAIMPMQLAQAVRRLPEIVTLLDAMDVRSDVRQVPEFRDRYYKPSKNQSHMSKAVGVNY
jgi:hypothetical protein